MQYHRKYDANFVIIAAHYRSSCQEVFCKKGVLGSFAKFTGKHLCHSLFSNKVVGHLWWLLVPLQGCDMLLRQIGYYSHTF